jgi:[protein-PII] uridylyltransferase
MAHISQRRDLNDDKLIDQFATKIGMTETLKMLYLLTFADIKAVGPEVWTEWKGFLLKELYEKAYDVLERGNFRFDARSERLKNRKRKVVANLSDEFGERRVKNALKSMSNRYLLSHRSPDITEHIRLAFSRGDQTLVLRVEHDPKSDYSQVYISTLDVPGLFSMIAGVMAANGVNILGAQIYTRGNGEALDILQVRSSAGTIIDNPKKWQKVEKDLNAVVEGRKRVDKLVAKRDSGSGLLPEKPKPQFANRVEIDNEISDQYSVIDIYAADRVGLLYDIASTLNEQGLYIGVSKISTKVDQVADTFYVQDIFGQKVRGDDKLTDLRRALLDCLSDEESQSN